MKKVPPHNLVFIVENDSFNNRIMTAEFAQNHAFEFKYFTNSADCIKSLDMHPIAVILDYDLNTLNVGERDGLHIMKEIKKREHHTSVIFFSTHENTEIAVTTIKNGAYDYLVINDHRFLRLENTLNNLLEYLDAKRDAQRYKMMSYGVIGAIAVWILITIIMFATGKWASRSGDLIAPF
jgi:two-component system response regulator AtoC